MFLFPVESRLIIHEAFDSCFSTAVDSLEFSKDIAQLSDLNVLCVADLVI
jgi:hypothetical protein